MAANTDIEVAPSEIEGLGVFAARDFRMGETVLVWDTSNAVTEEEYARLSDEQKDLIARYKGGWIRMVEPMNRVNHSCEANTTSRDGTDVATRLIHAGEEITSDYRKEMKIGERMECRCGAPSCHGFITGTAE